MCCDVYTVHMYVKIKKNNFLFFTVPHERKLFVLYEFEFAHTVTKKKKKQKKTKQKKKTKQNKTKQKQKNKKQKNRSFRGSVVEIFLFFFFLCFSVCRPFKNGLLKIGSTSSKDHLKRCTPTESCTSYC